MHMSRVILKLDIKIARIPCLVIDCVNFSDINWFWFVRAIGYQQKPKEEEYFIHGYISIIENNKQIVNNDQLKVLSLRWSIINQQLKNQPIKNKQITMKREKKSNNIFSKPILPQSLFYEEVDKQYQVGGKKIQGGWLKGTTEGVYKASLNSALEISDLKAQLDQIRRTTDKSPSDFFKMSDIRKMIQEKQMAPLEEEKKRTQIQLKTNVENLRLQKVSGFWGIYERKCRIVDQKLFIYSEKEKKEIEIDLKNYLLQIEQKGIKNEKSSDFPWGEKDNVRLFISGQNLRSYCIYGDQKQLKNITKKKRIESIQVTQIDFFKNLNNQYYQKMLMTFGNKLRVFEHLVKEKQKNDLLIGFDVIERSHILDQQLGDNNKHAEKLGEIFDSSYQNSESSAKINNKSNPNKSGNSGLSILSANLSPVPNIKNPNQSSSIIKLRPRKSTAIHYDDIDDEDDDADYRIQDFTLQIKQVAHSDSEEQSPSNFKLSTKNNQTPLQPADQNKKKDKNQIMIEESMIQQDYSESSKSQISKANTKNKQMKRSKNKAPESKLLANFQIIENIKFSHYIYIPYFEDFCAYSQGNLQMFIYQKVIPDYEYSNMKTPACTMQKIVFNKDPDVPRLFIPQQISIIQVSKDASDIVILLDRKSSVLKQDLTCRVDKVKYEIDESQLLYMKQANKIICGGKLKMIISPEQIDPQKHKQEKTQQFLERYLIKEECNRQDKDKFVDYKKKNFQICQKWNHKMIRRIINKGDEQEFKKAVFLGLPSPVFEKVVEPMTRKENPIIRTQSRVFIPFSSLNNFSYSYLENELMKMKCYDLRVFIRIDKLIELIVKTKKNQDFQRRIDQVCIFLYFKEGDEGMQKFNCLLILEVLKKLQKLLMQLKSAKEIEIMLSEYFQVQYEIDDIMKQISDYFN